MPLVHGKGRRARAQSLVEFALIAPVMIFLIMGAIQIGLIALVVMSLQGIAQDSARWMAISSRANSPGPAPACTELANTSRWPRARWADGRDTESINYRDCALEPSRILKRANFTKWQWTPACADGQDCYASGVRRPNEPIRLEVEYDWSNVAIMPGLTTLFDKIYRSKPKITVRASEVMQY